MKILLGFTENFGRRMPKLLMNFISRHLLICCWCCCCTRLVFVVLMLLPLLPLLPLVPLLPGVAVATVRVHAAVTVPALPRVLPLAAVLLTLPPLLWLLLLQLKLKLLCMLLLLRTAGGGMILPVWVGVRVAARHDATFMKCTFVLSCSKKAKLLGSRTWVMQVCAVPCYACYATIRSLGGGTAIVHN
jgi:hypothetical protein